MERRRRHRRALDRFGDLLHPGVLADIDHWGEEHPLHELRAALHAHTDKTSFFDTFAEALVARHLLRHGCDLRFEVPTPSGKRCDFEVVRGDEIFYLHLKRLQSDPRPRKLTISPRLRYLERIRRPYVVRVRWREGLDDEQMQRFVAEAAEFISRARVGDELTIRREVGGGREGAELGGVRVVAPWSGSHVSLAIGLPDGFIDQTPRIQRLMQRGYGQFMPGALNMILVCSMNHDDVEDFQNALLGSHIERWDAVPPKGKRIAHGRDADGFWSGGRSPESVIAGWFAFAAADHEIHVRIWHRKGMVLEAPMHGLMEELFGLGQA